MRLICKSGNLEVSATVTSHVVLDKLPKSLVTSHLISRGRIYESESLSLYYVCVHNQNCARHSILQLSQLLVVFANLASCILLSWYPFDKICSLSS